MFTSTNYKTKKIWGHSKKYVTCGKGKIIDKKVKQWATIPWKTQTVTKLYAFHANAKIHPKVYHMSETAMLPDSNNHDFKLFLRWLVNKCISCV